MNPAVQVRRNVLWHRQQPTYWFTVHREPHPEMTLPINIQGHIRVAVVLGIALAFLVGRTSSITSFCILLVVSLPMFGVVAYLRDWRTSILLALLLVVICCATPQSPFLPLFFLAMTLGYTELTNQVVCNSVRQLGSSWTLEETEYLYAVYSSPGKLSERERRQLVSTIDGDWRDVLIRTFALARTFSGLQAAKNMHQATQYCVVGGLTLSACFTTWLVNKYDLSYWILPWLFSLVALLVLCVAAVAGFENFRFNHTADDDRNYAIRHWFSFDTQIKTCSLAILFMVTTVLVVRSASYFPILLSSHAEVASSYLESIGQPHSEHDARTFLNAQPEHWIVASLQAIAVSHPHALRHGLALSLAAALCYFAPIFIAQTAMNILARPIPAAFAHEVAVAKKEVELGIVRELLPTDLERNE